MVDLSKFGYTPNSTTASGPISNYSVSAGDGGGFLTYSGGSGYITFRSPAPAVAQSDSEKDKKPAAAGKPIPIIIGAARPAGEIIWVHSFLNAKNECRADVAVCFGQNAFRRPLSLGKVILGSSTIYDRTGGAVVDPPNAVRFYDGTQTTKDPKMVQVQGDSKTPAYEGYIYAVLENVKLGEGFAAEFTDNGSITQAQNCDPFHDLDGIDLVPDKSTGLLYGIRNPLTRKSSLVISDGCIIINDVALDDLYKEQAGSRSYILYENVFPLECTGIVAISCIQQEFASSITDGSSPFTMLVNPTTGRRVGVAFGAGWVTAPGSTFALSRQSTGLHIKLSYELPFNPGFVCILRSFDREDNWYNAGFNKYGVALYPTSLPLTGSGNIAGQIVDYRTGELYYSKDPVLSEAFDFSLVCRNGTPGGEGLQPTGGWWLDTAPFVDDFVFARKTSSTAYLAAYRQYGDDTYIYFIRHDEDGMVAQSTAVVTNAVCSGITYDKKTQMTIFTATEAAGSSVNRTYHITEGGSISVVYAAPTGYELSSSNTNYAAPGTAILIGPGGNSALSYNTADGTTSTLYTRTDVNGTPIIDTSRNTIYLPTASGLVTQTVNVTNPDDILIQELLTDICTYKGYDVGDLSFSGMSTLFAKGMMIGSTSKVTDLINRLATVYGFTFSETDGKLKFIKHRTATGSYAINFDLTKDDLVERSGNDGVSVMDLQRSGSNNLLTALDFEYLDSERDYEATTQSLLRPVSLFDGNDTARKQSFSVPLSLDFASARALLYETFYALLQSETRFGFSVPSWHIRMEPGDIVRLTVDDFQQVGTVTRVTLRPDFAQDIECEAFMAVGITESGTSVVPVVTTSLGFGSYIHLNIPLLQAVDDAGTGAVRQYNVLTTLAVESWTGADLYRSFDFFNYQKILQYDRNPATVAIAKNAILPPHLVFATDYSNELTLEVKSGNAADFRTVTRSESLNMVTLAAYGREGFWEIISWEIATELASFIPATGFLTLTGKKPTITISGAPRIFIRQGSLILTGLKPIVANSGVTSIALTAGALVLYGLPMPSPVVALPTQGNYTGNKAGTITLSNLQRGLFGTQFFSDQHSSGDLVVVLDPVTINSLTYGTQQIGISAAFKAATALKPITDALKTIVTIGDVDKRPYPVAQLKATHTASASTLEISWVPCTTLGNQWLNSGNIDNAPLAEPENYSGIIYTTTGNFPFTTTSRGYSWANYGTELGATTPVNETTNIVTVLVWQVSAIWGDGPDVPANAIEI